MPTERPLLSRNLLVQKGGLRQARGARQTRTGMSGFSLMRGYFANTIMMHYFSTEKVVKLAVAVISQKAKYALRALLQLARATPGTPTLISDIAETQAIPKKFLEQILLDLRNHGIVASRRGKSGGYSLLKRPSEVTFGQVLRLVDGPIAPLPCLSRIAYRRCSDCTNEAQCEIRKVFAAVADATREVLDGTTLADVIGGKATIDIHTDKRIQVTEPAQ